MKKILIPLLFLLSLIISTSPSLAGFLAKQDGANLSVVSDLNCSTGMTCSVVKGVLIVTADAVGGSVVESDLAAVAEGLNIDRTAVFDYDFAVDGGVVSTIATGVSLPAKAIIEKCWFRIETQLVDAGAGTLAVQCEDANNILSAADQTGVAAGAFLASAVTGVAANMVDDIAATCDISWVIAGAALTAGKIRGWCRYSIHP